MEVTAELDWVRTTLERYREPLLRKVATNLANPRGHWPVEDLVERCIAALSNPTVVDRRLKGLDATPRQLLAILARSGQPLWTMGSLFELLLTLGHEVPLDPVFALLEAGLVYPVLQLGADGNPTPPSEETHLETLEHWLAIGGQTQFLLYTPNAILDRTRELEVELPDLGVDEIPLAPREADGLEWLLRFAALWQAVGDGPLRRTQQGDFFKRDYERLEDPLIASTTDDLVEVPALGYFLAAWAEHVDVLHNEDGELVANRLPRVWEENLWSVLGSLFRALFRLRGWNPLQGEDSFAEGQVSPFPSAYQFLFLLLERVPEEQWTNAKELEDWLSARHPFWTNEDLRPSWLKPWVERFLLGICYPLRVVRIGKDGEGNWLVALTEFGRSLLSSTEQPVPPTPFAQTLLIQPNLDIIAYRQGLTPALISRLTYLAKWKQLGAACTLQVEPETVYRALEAGESFASIQQLLEQHSSRELPETVLSSLRTWSEKRDRITIYPSAVLLEFNSAEEMQQALHRGLDLVRLTDTLALAPSEDALEYKHFRLTYTRDYTLPPERCVEVQADGLTLLIDPARADLLLETELPRFAEPSFSGNQHSKRAWLLTVDSLKSAKQHGWTVNAFEAWFQQRAGTDLPPTVRLLLEANELPPAGLRRYLVLEVGTPTIAEGLMQWSQTSTLIEMRLGPKALVILEENEALLRQRLEEGGIPLEG